VLTLALLGDTMLGRGVADALRRSSPRELVDTEVAEAIGAADLVVANLECCISERGRRWPDPAKPFFFRAPPEATAFLGLLGVDVVTLANNHALDFGADALLDTVRHLEAAGIAHVGAGADVVGARAPAVVEAGGIRLGIVALTDHPADFAAEGGRPGVAYADLRRGVPGWVAEAINGAAEESDVVLVSPHWGPNMVREPVPHVERAAIALAQLPASLVAGHSAHVFHGVESVDRDGGDPLTVLYDLGDFIDDYAVDRELRNDLGAVWFVTLEDSRVARVEVMPVALDFCHTRAADADEEEWVLERLEASCAALGSGGQEQDGRFVIELDAGRGS
jgi:poly-gamma-glutamate capsule biosynthesis protein CapA/YwtB (metallophosphatase superfamily)